MVFTHAYIETRVVNSAALTLDDVASLALGATENFNTETFALRFAAVLRTADTFFMCHI